VRDIFDDLYRPKNYYLTRGVRQSYLDRYLRNLIAFDIDDDDDKNNESIPFERRTKAITKGDPREFMG
jgi:hypothetical protein